MSTVKLILLEDVENLGLAGAEVNVAVGFARNYLIPGRKAMKASPGVLRQIAARKEKFEEQRRKDFEAMQVLAQKISQVELSIPAQASEDGQLFGSVNERTIAEHLQANGLAVDHHRIKLAEPLKALGMFSVEIKLHPEVTTTVKIWIVRG